MMIKLTRKDGKHIYLHRHSILIAEPHTDGAQITLMSFGGTPRVFIVKETPDEIAGKV